MVDPVSIGLSIGGKLIGGFADQSAAKKKERILRASLERQGKLQGEIDADIMREVGKMQAATPETERAAAMSEFVTQLRAARASRPESYGARGQVSDREAAELAALEGQLGTVADREADITARLESHGRMRGKEDLRRGRLATNIRHIGRKMSAEEFLAKLRLASARPSPWLKLAGDIMSGAGSAMSLGGGGAAAAGGGRSLMQIPGGFDPGVIYG